MPKVIPPKPTLETDTDHPLLGTGNGPYLHQIIGDLGGLTQFGAFIETLPSGSKSSFRHWHETEDEMIYMLTGEVILIEEHETPLRAGDAACWPAGAPVGHHLHNRSDTDATYLTIGTRHKSDVIHYPDNDVVTHKNGPDRRYEHADGTAYPTQGESK